VITTAIIQEYEHCNLSVQHSTVQWTVLFYREKQMVHAGECTAKGGGSIPVLKCLVGTGSRWICGNADTFLFPANCSHLLTIIAFSAYSTMYRYRTDILNSYPHCLWMKRSILFWMKTSRWICGNVDTFLFLANCSHLLTIISFYAFSAMYMFRYVVICVVLFK
jgi:hypothetical protein